MFYIRLIKIINKNNGSTIIIKIHVHNNAYITYQSLSFLRLFFPLFFAGGKTGSGGTTEISAALFEEFPSFSDLLPVTSRLSSFAIANNSDSLITIQQQTVRKNFSSLFFFDI